MRKSGEKLLDNRIFRYLFSGVTAALIDYVIYEIMVLLVFGSADWVAAAVAISGIAGTFAAYFLHSRITWRDRDPGKYGLIKLLLWNALMMIGVRPVLSVVVGWLTGLYEWALGICQWIRLPFSYDFVASTGIYLIVTAMVAVLNYFFYDWVVFGKRGDASGSGAGSGKRKAGAAKGKSAKR